MSEQFAGSCICGAIKYQIDGNVRSFFHCHCERCRKANGTGHASNVIVTHANVKWVSGENDLRSFKVPGAERFRTMFCKTCGSPMPRIAPDNSYAVVPAGSLDESPDLHPTDRIFWESRAPWSCDAGDIPSWAAYPERT